MSAGARATTGAAPDLPAAAARVHGIPNVRLRLVWAPIWLTLLLTAFGLDWGPVVVAFAATFIVYDLVYAAAVGGLHRLGRSGWAEALGLWIDIAGLTAQLAVIGGLWSPWVGTYLFTLLPAGIQRGGRAAALAGLFVTLSYAAALAFGEMGMLPDWRGEPGFLASEPPGMVTALATVAGIVGLALGLIAVARSRGIEELHVAEARRAAQRLEVLQQRLERLVSRLRSRHADITLPKAPDAPAPDAVARLEEAFDVLALQLDRQLDLVARTDRARRDLLVNVSHDLRTPLSALLATVETLAELGDDARVDRRRYAERAVQQARLMSRRLGALFELANLDAPSFAARREPIALAELVQDTALRFEDVAHARGVELHLAPPGTLPAVAADPGLIERAVENLLDNALRHTERGGRIELRFDADPRSVTLEIADTGDGMAPALRSALSGDRAALEASDVGAGVGLRIVRRIVELHDGVLHARANAPQGTVVHLAFPPRG